MHGRSFQGFCRVCAAHINLWVHSSIKSIPALQMLLVEIIVWIVSVSFSAFLWRSREPEREPASCAWVWRVWSVAIYGLVESNTALPYIRTRQEGYLLRVHVCLWRARIQTRSSTLLKRHSIKERNGATNPQLPGFAANISQMLTGWRQSTHLKQESQHVWFPLVCFQAFSLANWPDWEPS